MSHDKQEIIVVDGKDALFGKVAALAVDGYRLVKISCSTMELLQIDYTLDKEYKLVNVRILIPFDGPELASVSGIYGNAFLYENEIHDLFGVKFHGLTLDYQGNFYRTKLKFPFANFLKEQAAKEAGKG